MKRYQPRRKPDKKSSEFCKVVKSYGKITLGSRENAANAGRASSENSRQGFPGQNTAQSHGEPGGVNATGHSTPVSHDKENSVMNGPTGSSRRRLEIDVEKYQALLDDPSLTEDQKRQLIEALWSIIVAFVDLGFGVHPMQQVIERQGCGQNAKNESHGANQDQNRVEYVSDPITEAFNKAASPE